MSRAAANKLTCSPIPKWHLWYYSLLVLFYNLEKMFAFHGQTAASHAFVKHCPAMAVCQGMHDPQPLTTSWPLQGQCQFLLLGQLLLTHNGQWLLHGPAMLCHHVSNHFFLPGKANIIAEEPTTADAALVFACSNNPPPPCHHGFFP